MMNQNRKLTGKDVITIGIYSAIYFVMNFAAMMTGLIPLLWILLPGTVAILTGIPFLLMVVKVPKPGAVLQSWVSSLLFCILLQGSLPSSF